MKNNSINKIKYSIFIFSILIIFLLISCGEELPNQKPLFQIGNNYQLPKFDEENAYDQIKKQTLFGPRNPGSLGHKKALNYFQEEFEKYCDSLILQTFSYNGYNNERLELTNIIAKFNPTEKNRIIICAHWDTRPRAEHDADSTKRNFPIIGANDGASGCGIILELARLLNETEINYGVDLILFDGEDYGKESDLENFCLGSKYFAANLPEGYAPVFAILIDMVGDKEASFYIEQNSARYAPDILNLVWNIAASVQADIFKREEKSSVYDDHIPLNRGGIRAVDIIDGELIGANTPVERRNYWHTHNDTMENIGKETLKQVGDVLTYLIFSIQFNT